MAGWDDIKNRALSSVNQAAQKADRMAQIAGLRRQVQQAQQDRQAALAQLGASAYASYQATQEGPAEWQPLCDQVQACDRRIESLTQSLDQLSQDTNAATCAQCHNLITSPAKFCPHCGAALA